MTHNNITGDKIATKAPTKAYRDGWEQAFGKKPEVSDLYRAVRVLQRIEDGKAKPEPLEPRPESSSRIPGSNK